MKRARIVLSLVFLLLVIVTGLPSVRVRAEGAKCTCYIPQLKFYGVWIDTNACGGECTRNEMDAE